MAGKKKKSSKSLKVGDQNDASVYWHWWSEEEAGQERLGGKMMSDFQFCV